MVVITVLVLVAGCSVPATLQRRYVGELAGCEGATTATLTRIRNQFAFTPADSALVIRGTIGPDGTLAGSLDTQPAGNPAYVLAVSGQIGDDSARVTYATPRCTARGTLARRRISVLP
jgi:hypothetical protein